MLKSLVSIAVLVAVAAGCGSDEPAPSAATTPEPPALPTPPPATADADADIFEKGHSPAVRAYYAGAHPAGPDDGSNAAVEEEYHQPPRPATGGIGDAITLTGTNIGVRMRVTPTAVVDPASASKPPRAGTRYVAVKLRMRSTGIAILESPMRQALLAYGVRKAKPVLGAEAPCSNGFDESVRVDVGNSVKGCVLFEVPVGRRPRQLQLALEVVPADAGGRWSLR